MKGFWKLAGMEALLYLREPMASFFTLIFPVLLLFLFGSIYGNRPNPFFGGRGTVDVSTPAYMAIIIGSTALMSIPIGISTYRERGILRRFRATPIRPAAILGAEISVHLVMTLFGAALLVAAARLVYGLRFGGNAALVFLALVLSTLSFFAVGFLVASLAPSARVANAIGMVLYFPNLFLSGATFPTEMFPPTIKAIGNFVPMTHIVRLLQGLWFGEPVGKHLTEIAVLGGLLVVGAIVSALTFRWE
jgi:ABC-2 type transport system permease protein